MVQGEGTWQLGNGGSSMAMGHGEGTAAVVVPWVQSKAVCSSSRAQDVMGNVKQTAENALEMPQVWGCPALWVLQAELCAIPNPSPSPTPHRPQLCCCHGNAILQLSRRVAKSSLLLKAEQWFSGGPPGRCGAAAKGHLWAAMGSDGQRWAAMAPCVPGGDFGAKKGVLWALTFEGLVLTEDGGMACASSQNLSVSQKVSKPKSNKVRSITRG